MLDGPVLVGCIAVIDVIDALQYRAIPTIWYLYNVTLTYVLFQFAFIAVVGRFRSPLSGQERPGSDATWFLGVYFWGFESLFRLAGLMGGDITNSRTGLVAPFALQIAIDEHIVPGLVVFLAVLFASFMAERWAALEGFSSRSRGAGVPPGVIAALLGVQFTWTGFLAWGFPR